ncbi:MAG: HYR domain-containing protein, partial [Actinobacteria bacterium]|nr:HYR domain-containing protein [Actinomycetota bacterium]
IKLTFFARRALVQGYIIIHATHLRHQHPQPSPRVIAIAPKTPATSKDGATVNYDVSAHDNRDGSPKLSCQPPSGSIFKIGTTTVKCSAQDAAGNSSEASFTVTVTSGRPLQTRPELVAPDPTETTPPRADQTRPELIVPDPMEQQATSRDGAMVEYKVSARDDRDGPLRPSCQPPSGSIFRIGTTNVGCSAQDAAGNTAKRSFTVTIIDPARTNDAPRSRIIQPQPQNNVELQAISSPTGVYYAEVHIIAQVRDPDGDPLTYVWHHSVNNGPQKVVSTRLSPTVRLQIPPRGNGDLPCSASHWLTLTASDKTATTKERVKVRVTMPPGRRCVPAP